MSPNTAFQNPHMFEIVAGLEESLRKRGYRLVLHGTDSTSACALAKEIISRKSADGIAVHVGIMSHPLAALLTQLRFPHIILLMGTPCSLSWREDGDREYLWVLDPSHQIPSTMIV